MNRPSRRFLGVVAALVFIGAGSVATIYALNRSPVNTVRQDDEIETDTVDVRVYTPPPDDDTLLADDRLEDKKTAFDPKLVDRRPIEGWSLNASEAVIKLDVPLVKPDVNPEFLVLHPSYAAAEKNAGRQVLASVNMIDGKAKQFDDGLYAALDQAYYVGHGDVMKGHLKLIRRIYDKVAKGSPAAEYLATGLVLAKEPIEASAAAKARAASFMALEVDSKPIGFYTWTPKLSECFTVLRYFSRTIDAPAVSKAIARVIGDDKELRADYEKAIHFYGKLSNPLVGLSPADLIEKPELADRARISLFPPSSSREGELFLKLFPLGVPENADLMRELITSIRSGKVDLKPRKDGGWYDYQVYALETLLLPEKGAETNKILLTKAYKKRMLEAFKALITKRRETHARAIGAAKSEASRPAADLEFVRPRLRVEPNPTYYLRTARSYAFLADFLESSLGEPTMKSLHGLREDRAREMDLHSELRRMRDLFYGLHFLSAEDIGMSPSLLEGELVDRATCEKVATEWLANRQKDPDLLADTRVSVPIYYDANRGVTRLWMTVGVRLSPLKAQYVRAPRVRPADGSKDWETVPAYKLISDEYLIPVDEFAEVEIRGGRVLNRMELRALCDEMKTKDRIIEAIRAR